MDYIKEWCIYICSTVLLSVIFSFLIPKGNLGRFYKLVISLFIFVSFLFPLSNNGVKLNDIFSDVSKISLSDNTNSIGNEVVTTEIKSLLNDNGYVGSSVNCSSKINSNGEIEIENITVAVADEYDKEDVKKLILDNLSLNVRVINLGK